MKTLLRPAAVNHRIRTHVLLAVAGIVSVGWAASKCSADEPLTGRRERVANMSAAEKRALELKQDRFNRLPEQEQRRLRELHQQIKQHDEAARLEFVLERYAEWLKTISASQRADLQKLSTDERISKIRETKRRFEEERFGRFTRHPLKHEDARIVFAWLDDEVAQSEEHRLEKMLTDRERHMLKTFKDEPLRRVMMLKMVYRRNPDVLNQLSQPQIETLMTQLSAEAKNQYQELADAEKQRQLVEQWIHAALTSRSPPPRIREDELEQFFATLNAEQRDELTKMPRDRMYRELGRMYFMQKWGRRSWGRRPGDGPSNRPFRPRGGRRGDDRGRRGDDRSRRSDDWGAGRERRPAPPPPSGPS